jgi:hypothetical protein
MLAVISNGGPLAGLENAVTGAGGADAPVKAGRSHPWSNEVAVSAAMIAVRKRQDRTNKGPVIEISQLEVGVAFT